MRQNPNKRAAPRKLSVAIFIACAAMAGSAHAMSFDTGNPDIELRWDNTIRYNAAVRAEKIDSTLYNSGGTDETEGRFDRGDMIMNRLDIVTEMDLIYKGRHGFRVSAAGWRDFAYDNDAEGNPRFPSNYDGGRFNGYTQRYIVGPGGELLDAFVFGTFDLGNTVLSLKAGRHNLYWGEALFSTTNSIAYSMAGVDGLKAASSPGIEAKETFMPRNQVSATWILTDDISMAAHYAFEWDPFRIAPGGTFFASSDASRSDFASPPGVRNGSDLRPSNEGDFGVNLRWSPPVMGGTVGLYYRKFDEKLPQAFTQVETNGVTTVRSVRFGFARDTELYGVSLSGNVGPVAVAGEVSYRKDAALNSTSTRSARVPLGASYSYKQAEGARGNTMHAVVNGVWLMPRTSLWTGGTLTAEVNYSRLLEVTENDELFNKAANGSDCAGGVRAGCMSRDAWGMNLGVTPQIPQAFPSWDLSFPMSVAYQIKGNGPALGGGSEGATTYSVGVTGTYRSVHEFSLRFTDYERGNRATRSITEDHAWLGFTYKTVF